MDGTIPLAWYRINSSLEVQIYVKRYKITQPPAGARKHTKPYRKIRKLPCFSDVSFRMFGPRPGVGDFVTFHILKLFPCLRCFCSQYQARGIGSKVSDQEFLFGSANPKAVSKRMVLKMASSDENGKFRLL